MIEPADNKVRDIQERIKIPGVENLILQADADSARFTPRLAEELQKISGSDKEYFENIHRWVRKNIRYKEDHKTYVDSRGEVTHLEEIKSPGRLWADRVGDCKSMAVFVGSLLQNSGHRYFYRLTRYDPENPDQGHIYTIAKTKSGKEYAIDPVIERFNDEPRWWRKKDIMETTGIYVSGVNQAPKNIALKQKQQPVMRQNGMYELPDCPENRCIVCFLIGIFLSLE